MAIKSVLKITGIIFGLLICSLVVLVFLVDANMFKPRIEALAKDHGIALSMRGDLHWAFWPAIGLAAQEVSVAALDTPQEPIADVKKASFLIAFVPLMRGDFQVKHILIEGAVIDLRLNEQGVGNWEKLIKEKTATAGTSTPKKNGEVRSENLKIAIEKISIQHSELRYTDFAKGSRLQLKDIALEMDDVNLDGKPFTLDFAWETHSSQTKSTAAPLVIKSKLSSKIALDDALTSVKISDGELALDINNSPTLKFNYSLKLTDINNNLAYQGDIKLATFNARQLLAAVASHPKTANEKSLTEMHFAANIIGDKKQVSLNELNIQLDKTNLKGSASITNFASQAMKLDLQGDEINLDEYLAPKPEVKTPVAATQPNGDEPLIPLEPLRKINVDSKITFKKLMISELALENVQLEIDAKNGLIQQQLNASAYSGNIHHKTILDVRGQSAQLQFETIVQGLEIAPVLAAKKLDKSLHLSGSIQANARAQTIGVTKNQIMAALTGTATFSGAKVRLAPINIEQQFCKFIALVNRTEEPAKTWDSYTELRELSGNINIAKRVITIESVNAGVQKILLGVNGNINLASGSYDFSLPLKLVRDANDTPTSITTSAQGCAVNSNYWAERSMSLLRCKGTYTEINPASDCRPDKEMLIALTKDFAEYKLREKHGEKLEAKKSELIKKLDDKLGGEGKAEKAKDLLKNLLKKKDDK